MSHLFIQHVKETLSGIIRDMGESPSLFVCNPDKDFTRKRKMDFESFLNFSLSMEGNSLKKELYDFFSFNPNVLTESAFNQQRAKVLPEAFEFLFHEFTSSFNTSPGFKGYHLLACDGSALNIYRNPIDSSTYFQNKADDSGFNQLHLNALYNLTERIYVDAIVQDRKNLCECRAMTDMLDRSPFPQNTILIADRGYECYNIFAHAEKKGWGYVIRAKDIYSNGISSSFQLPDGPFDLDAQTILTKKQTNAVKAEPKKYRRINKDKPFDYLDLHQNQFYPIRFRIVRFKISEDTYECLITNLDREQFTVSELKELYHLRWGIETGFRELKYAIGLTNFHARKKEYIKQEIFARLVLYNFCEIITTHVIINQKGERKYIYQANFTMAIYICKQYLHSNHCIRPPDVELLIQKNILPIRPGRQDPRKVKAQKTVSFLYRVA